MNTFESFTLTPMTAGDIIDRAVRIYRRNFPALLRIVLAPSLIAYAGGIIYYAGFRNFSLYRGESRVLLTTSLIIFGAVLWLIGKVAFYAMLGGASKSLIYLFFDGTPLRASNVYRTVRRKFGTLISASILVFAIALGVGFLIYTCVVVLILIYISTGGMVAASLPRWAMITLNIAFGTLLMAGTVTALLAVYSRIVYVPQVLMVEEKGASSSIGRSFTLAGGEVKRIGVLILFWFYIAWSFWLLLMIPVWIYGYWSGIDLNPFNLDAPIWFSVAQQTVTQISEIIIAPIAMMGFTLLYLDSRVRKEGFDVELMANRVLAPPAFMPPPIAPMLRAPAARQSEPPFPSILGLNDYQPFQPPVEPVYEEPNARQVVENIEPLFVEPAGMAVEAGSEPAHHVEIPALIEAPPRSAPKAIIHQVPIEFEPRICRWCQTGADAEDRFCRVCGAVF